jgi:plastocyanin
MEERMKTTIIAAAFASFVGQACAGEVTENQIKLFQFQPKELSVKAGTTVKWMNGDDIEHSVTSKMDGQFDSGFFSKDGTYEFTFAAPGTYEYLCKRHPSMTAKVVVIE